MDPAATFDHERTFIPFVGFAWRCLRVTVRGTTSALGSLDELDRPLDLRCGAHDRRRLIHTPNSVHLVGASLLKFEIARQLAAVAADPDEVAAGVFDAEFEHSPRPVF